MSARIALLAVLLTALTGPAAALSLPDWLGFGAGAQETAAPRPVVTEIVEDRDPNLPWIPGVVASRTQVAMAFQTLGRMVARDVDIGDRVVAGDLLAQQATEDLEASTRAARAAVDAAEVQLSTARTTLERTQALTERNVATAAQLEEAQRMMASAQAAADQAHSELVQAQDAEGFSRMIAPFDGVISAVHVAPGTVVGAGEPVLELSAEDGREALIDLPEAALSGIGRGAVFSVWQRSAPEAEVAATLDRIEPLADRVSRTRRLYLTLPEDAPFRLGALVQARFGSTGEPVLTLPEVAIITTDQGPRVWRVIREGDAAHVQAVPVQTGPGWQGRVMIRQGLAAGDEIVVRGVNSLQDGQSVGRREEP